VVVAGIFLAPEFRQLLNQRMVGVVNTGETFPIALSYRASESRNSFDFIWDSFKAHLGRTGLLVLSFVTGLKGREQRS
jgi:hypothetical protein